MQFDVIKQLAFNYRVNNKFLRSHFPAYFVLLILLSHQFCLEISTHNNPFSKFIVGFYIQYENNPHLFPDNLGRKHKRKLMKRFVFFRCSFISFACAECFGLLKFFLGQPDCKALLPKGQLTQKVNVNPCDDLSVVSAYTLLR